MNGYIVIQRNTRGIISVASAALDTEEEAMRAAQVQSRAFPTMRFRVVQIVPVTGWMGKEEL